MKRILVLLILPIMAISYDFQMPSLSSMKEMASGAKKAYQEYNNQKKTDTTLVSSVPPRGSSGEMLRIPPNITTTFSSKHCTKVIKKNAYMACYEPELKISTMVYYKVIGKDLRKGYIKKRPGFYDNKSLPSYQRAYSREYSRTGYDRGHSRPHAATAYDRSLLYETYDMINIWPQTPEVNRNTWKKAEKYVRMVARERGSVNVINIAEVKRNHKTIGKGVVVPAGFYKVLYTDDRSFEKCFYYGNIVLTASEIKSDKLKQHVVDCSSIRI